jgi:CubicO group peptidase (beta-lactamase class C family)
MADKVRDMSDRTPMEGFPPPRESQVNLGNWQEPPFNRWSFQHLREVIPTQRIACGLVARPLDDADDPLVPDDVAVTRFGSGSPTVSGVFADTWTDAVLVLHHGKVVLERYFEGMRADTPHLLMSVSKSIVGCVTGILADQGRLDTGEPITRYVPEIAGSGYDGATVRHLLDMRTGVAFSEVYQNPDAEVRVIERHMGWRPDGGSDRGGMYAYLASLGAEGPHGGPFVYRSADTDMLGWVCERAAGIRMADLVSSLIWGPMGAEYDAEITCDSVGSAVHDGGICATARDVARFGQLLLEDGSVGDQAVVPDWWLQESRHLDADIRAAFAASDSEPVLPGGWYRNQFWFVPGPSGDIQLGLGIHGQMVFVDRATRTVAVKLSSWPTEQDHAYLLDTIRAFTAAGRHLAGLGGTAEIADWTRPTGPSGVAAGRERGRG